MGLTWLYSCDPPSQGRTRVLSTVCALCPALCWVLANHTVEVAADKHDRVDGIGKGWEKACLPDSWPHTLWLSPRPHFVGTPGPNLNAQKLTDHGPACWAEGSDYLVSSTMPGSEIH